MSRMDVTKRFGRSVGGRISATLALAVALTTAVAAGSSEATKPFGETLRIEKATPIAEILAEPGKWDGKTVRVEGEVQDVCPRMGCWMTLTEGDAVVRIKVEDGVIVFPKDAKGKRAVAEGVVEVQEMDRDAWVAWRRHLAEERGEAFDESGVGEGPFRMVQIAGRGAEIRGL